MSQIQIYKPNASVKGFAASFRYSTDKDCVFAQLIRQSTWNDEQKLGGFKESMTDPTKKTTAALGFTEIGAILDCIERNRPFKTYHDSDKEAKSISFTPWMDKNTPPTHLGFSFAITVKGKNGEPDNAFYIGLTFPEARELREFLVWALHQHFGAYARNQPQQEKYPTAPAPAKAQQPLVKI